MSESLNKQVDRLAAFILDADAGYPNRSAGAIDTAIDWITDLRAEVNRLRAEIEQMSGPDHFIVFSNDGWTVEHPAACRANGPLSECQATAVAAEQFDVDPGIRGRFLFDPATGNCRDVKRGQE